MNLVINQNGKLVTTSRMIADRFKKRHSDVIRSIETLECSDEFTERNFALSGYKDSTGRNLPEYIITRDGFSFLVMGFTGKEAAKFKEEFINAFNQMEQSVKELQKPNEDQLLLDAMRILTERVENQNKQLELANSTIQKQAPKVKYVDNVLLAENVHPVNVIAKELGMSAIDLNKKLQKMGIQYKSGGTWVLTARYQNRGYTKTRTHTHYDSEGKQRTAIHTYWTELGRAFLHHKLKN